MSFGKRLADVRKDKGFSQEQLGKAAGTISVAIGRYERGEVKPSVEMAAELARVLGVSLDYLVGLIDEPLDEAMLRRVLELQQLPEDERKHVFFALDAMLRDSRARRAYGV